MDRNASGNKLPNDVSSGRPHPSRHRVTRPPSADVRATLSTRDSGRLILAVLAGIIFFLLPVDAGAVRSYKILVLFSFHANLDRTESIKEGLESRLAEEALHTEIIYEYMDSRRYSGLEFEKRLCALIRYKYAYQPLDAIITVHSYAFNYLSDRRDWFSPTPWIFCGVDDQVYEDKSGNHSRSTGLTVFPDIAATLETALRLHPDRNQVYAIIDTAQTRQHFLIALDAERSKLKNRAKIQLVDTPSLEEFEQFLKSMPEKALLLILSFARDKDGNYFPFERVRQLLHDHGRLPVYTLWENDVGEEIMGGKVITFANQGREAAGMALRIIRGENPEAIPVVRRSANQYIFNDKELKRFGVPLSALPEGSVVVNKPPSFYSVNKGVIWLLLGGLFFLSLFTLFLIFNIIRRRRAEGALQVSIAQLASEYEQRKHLSRRLIDLLEMDRQDVARELHDHLGQILTTMKLDLAAFKNRLVFGKEECEPFIGGVEEKLNEVMKGVKDTARGLRPVALELHGLKPALQSLIAGMGESSGLNLHLFCGDFPDRFGGDKELAIFRIVQEALNNAVKHSGACNVHVNLMRRDHLLSLSIEDDGCGFDSDAVLHGNGTSRSLGLILMRERAIQVGGTFQVNSRIGQGANIMVEVPLT
jgi:signal transduction histidine kinase